MVFRHHLSGSDNTAPLLCNAMTSLQLQDASALDYINVQQLPSSAFYFDHSWATVGRDAHLRFLSGNFGSSLSKTSIGSELGGAGANASLFGAYFADNFQHFDQRTVQYHKVAHATSNVLYKGAITDKARTVYQGIIKVFAQAQKTDAYQANRNLLLSEYARADSIPGLEIEANDVLCTHGATVGKVDEQQLFYLMTRGLSRRQATAMIVAGFFSEIWQEYPPELLTGLVEAVENKLETQAGERCQWAIA